MTSLSSHRSTVPDHSLNSGQAAEIAEESPEGVPAHPEAGPRQIGLLLAAIVVGLFVVALALAVALAPAAGVAVGALALLILLCNPAVWARTLRAKEQHEIEQRGRGDEIDKCERG